jgi:hypothetical protein
MLREQRYPVANSRREFLVMLAGAPLALAGGCAMSHESRAPAPKSRPTITNYSEDGNYVLVEGKTLLIALSFPGTTIDLNGDLSVRLATKNNYSKDRSAGSWPETKINSLKQ